MPHFLSRPDPGFSGFTRQQVADLYALRGLARAQGQPDRFWSGVPVVQDDGTARVEPLTVELVEPHVKRYWTRHSVEAFVLAPSGWDA